jgi:hypothetical protein
VLGKGTSLFQNIKDRQLFEADSASVSSGYFLLKLKRK